jgi:hypothetical protein
MNAVDLVKATLVCGAVAGLVFRYPAIGQVAMIAGLTLIWLSYAYKTIQTRRHR